MVRVTMTDEDRIDLPGSCLFQQPRHRGVAQVNDQPESIVLDYEAAAGLTRFRPPAAATQKPRAASQDLSQKPLAALRTAWLQRPHLPHTRHQARHGVRAPSQG